MKDPFLMAFPLIAEETPVSQALNMMTVQNSSALISPYGSCYRMYTFDDVRSAVATSGLATIGAVTTGQAIDALSPGELSVLGYDFSKLQAGYDYSNFYIDFDVSKFRAGTISGGWLGSEAVVASVGPTIDGSPCVYAFVEPDSHVMRSVGGVYVCPRNHPPRYTKPGPCPQHGVALIRQP